jgi:EPS-associated MarR family transcriptional regulator
VRQPFSGTSLASTREERQAEIRLRILRLIAENPERSTRELASAVGISNGSAYYVVTALIDKGFVKLDNFTNSPRKSQYAYLLTARGIREKSLLTHSFIKRKREEFETLKAEIKALEEEAGLAVEATPASRGGKQ